MRANCSFREAGRMLTRLKGRSDRGLLPDSGDSQRLMSWPVALAALFETHGELPTLLRTEFAPEGRLQLRFRGPWTRRTRPALAAAGGAAMPAPTWLRRRSSGWAIGSCWMANRPWQSAVTGRRCA